MHDTYFQKAKGTMFIKLAALAIIGALTVACSSVDSDAVGSINKVYRLASVDNYNEQSIRHCNRASNAPTLVTFDDSGTPEQIKAILDKLDQYNMRAAFFPVGEWAEKNMDLINEMKVRGHIVGNHTYSHARLGQLSVTDEAKFYGEIYPSDGIANTDPMLLRPPFEDGAYTDGLATKLTSKNIQECTWTVDSHDWDGSSVEQIMNRLQNGDQYTQPLGRGDVVLFHMFYANAPKLIDAFVSHLMQMNVSYETIHS